MNQSNSLIRSFRHNTFKKLIVSQLKYLTSSLERILSSITKEYPELLMKQESDSIEKINNVIGRIEYFCELVSNIVEEAGKQFCEGKKDKQTLKEILLRREDLQKTYNKLQKQKKSLELIGEILEKSKMVEKSKTDEELNGERLMKKEKRDFRLLGMLVNAVNCSIQLEEMKKSLGIVEKLLMFRVELEEENNVLEMWRGVCGDSDLLKNVFEFLEKTMMYLESKLDDESLLKRENWIKRKFQCLVCLQFFYRLIWEISDGVMEDDFEWNDEKFLEEWTNILSHNGSMMLNED